MNPILPFLIQINVLSVIPSVMREVQFKNIFIILPTWDLIFFLNFWNNINTKLLVYLQIMVDYLKSLTWLSNSKIQCRPLKIVSSLATSSKGLIIFALIDTVYIMVAGAFSFSANFILPQISKTKKKQPRRNVNLAYKLLLVHLDDMFLHMFDLLIIWERLNQEFLILSQEKVSIVYAISSKIHVYDSFKTLIFKNLFKSSFTTLMKDIIFSYCFLYFDN